ncbi:MAG: asparaginase domain-containing protein [Sulfuricurvum sp.]|uniref:asparaginase domain-containing protein n=1 Tax=Sulfuricurvum sp. TaxID=2025608 RepID=UPI00263A02E8|nr:asparaginase domain-containing protein [Sulfuricurvum sp.]MDD2369381.1 asparaginase domain-containing protein [Sulfuricurvum sp.]MDD2950854.1 asparaginase domain-containing protein [Sulfuricurvum sp.]MDD5117498.1 asparaginase domain-containing protein [Sulfuricurvum sp.]
MRILNTGGTFNKRYDPIKGELFVPNDNLAIEQIIESMVISIPLQGVLYKDSLEMDNHDRSVLAHTVSSLEEKIIIVVHGTDTMDLSAEYVASLGLDKVIVFTGAMIPFGINPIEATANLSMAIGYAQNAQNGVHIVMQGVMGPYDQVKKNKGLGKFEYV